MERAFRFAKRQGGVGFVGLFERAFGAEVDHGVQLVVDLGDAVKVRFDNLDRRDLFVLNGLRNGFCG